MEPKRDRSSVKGGKHFITRILSACFVYIFTKASVSIFFKNFVKLSASKIPDFLKSVKLCTAFFIDNVDWTGGDRY